MEARVARFRKEPAGSSSPDIVSQAPRSSSVSAVLCCSDKTGVTHLPIFNNGPCVFQLFVNRREFETLSATKVEHLLVLMAPRYLAVLFTATLALLTSVDSVTAPNTGLAGHSVCWASKCNRQSRHCYCM